jgi:hypothetical protein
MAQGVPGPTDRIAPAMLQQPGLLPLIVRPTTATSRRKLRIGMHVRPVGRL